MGEPRPLWCQVSGFPTVDGLVFFQVYLQFQDASVAKSCEKIEMVQIGRNSQVLELTQVERRYLVCLREEAHVG